MLEREVRGGVEILTLAHGKVNALDLELCEALDQALGDVERSDARALVLTGSGRSFSAGVDLFRVLKEGADYVEAFLPALETVFDRLFFLGKPVIAALNGHAIAGGYVLACAADVRLMADGEGRVGVPELLVGVPFPPVGFEILRSTLPASALSPLLLLGRTQRPQEALAQGLVHELSPPERLGQRALELASSLAALRPELVALTKRDLRAEARARLSEGGEARFTRVLSHWTSPESHEAIREYLDRTLGR